MNIERLGTIELGYSARGNRDNPGRRYNIYLLKVNRRGRPGEWYTTFVVVRAFGWRTMKTTGLGFHWSMEHHFKRMSWPRIEDALNFAFRSLERQIEKGYYLIYLPTIDFSLIQDSLTSPFAEFESRRRQ